MTKYKIVYRQGASGPTEVESQVPTLANGWFSFGDGLGIVLAVREDDIVRIERAATP